MPIQAMTEASRSLHYSALAFAVDSMDSRIRTHGISESDWADFTGPLLWTPQERYRHERTFHAVMYGALQDSGLEPFPLPIEYVAACLSLTVQPPNGRLACAWFASSMASRQTEIAQQTPRPDRVTPAELFSVYYGFVSDTTCKKYIDAFDAKVAYRTRRVQPPAESLLDPALPPTKTSRTK